MRRGQPRGRTLAIEQFNRTGAASPRVEQQPVEYRTRMDNPSVPATLIEI